MIYNIYPKEVTKYKNLEIWNEGWETIMLGAYPKGDEVKKEIDNSMDRIAKLKAEYQ